MPDKSDRSISEQPKTQRFIVDRPIYHTPGKRPHMPGTELDLDPDEIDHLVQTGFLHRAGSDPVATSVTTDKQVISVNQGPGTVAPPLPAAPLPYQSKSEPAAT